MIQIIRASLLATCVVVGIGATARAQQPSDIADSARRLVERLDRESLRFLDARMQIAQWYCEKRKYAEALEQAKDLSPGDRIQLLSFLAKLTVDSKEKTAADRMLAATLTALSDRSEDEAYSREAAFSMELAIKNGNLDLASKFESFLDEGSIGKGRALLKLAQAHAGLKDQKQAAKLVNEALAQTEFFDEDEQKDLVEFLVDASRTLIAMGDLERAKSLATRANAILLSQSDPNTGDQVTVASLFGDLGNLSLAVGIIESMEPTERASAFASLSFHARDNDAARSLLDRSRELTLRPTKETYAQSSELYRLVSAFINAGRIDETFDLLRKITDEYQLRDAAVALAEALQKNGKSTEAESALDIARSRAENIASEKSEDIPSSASGSRAKEKSQSLTTLVKNYIDIDRLSVAEASARRIDQPQYRAVSLSRVARAFATKNQMPKARSLLTEAFKLSSEAPEYRHDRYPELALFEIARTMFEVGTLNDASMAFRRFLEHVDKEHSLDQYAGYLYILAEVAQSRGISMDSRTRKLLKRMEDGQLNAGVDPE